MPQINVVNFLDTGNHRYSDLTFLFIADGKEAGHQSLKRLFRMCFTVITDL